RRPPRRATHPAAHETDAPYHFPRKAHWPEGSCREEVTAAQDGYSKNTVSVAHLRFPGQPSSQRVGAKLDTQRPLGQREMVLPLRPHFEQTPSQGMLVSLGGC